MIESTKGDLAAPRLDTLSVRSRVALSTAAQTAGNLLSAVISVAVLRLTTSHLGPTRYGYLTTVVAVISIFSLLADLGLTTITSRDIAQQPLAASRILSANLSLRICLSVGAAPVIIAVAYFVYPTERSNVVVGVAILSLDILLNAVSNTLLTYFAARTRNDVVALVLLVNKVVYLFAQALFTPTCSRISAPTLLVTSWEPCWRRFWLPDEGSSCVSTRRVGHRSYGNPFHSGSCRSSGMSISGLEASASRSSRNQLTSRFTGSVPDSSSC